MAEANIESSTDEVEHAMESVLDAFNPKNNKLNWLLVTIPVAVYFSIDHNLTMAFLFSMIATMPLAFLMGKGTEEIASELVKQ